VTTARDYAAPEKDSTRSRAEPALQQGEIAIGLEAKGFRTV
jgi:hypothetical protein